MKTLSMLPLLFLIQFAITPSVARTQAPNTTTSPQQAAGKLVIV